MPAIHEIATLTSKGQFTLKYWQALSAVLSLRLRVQVIVHAWGNDENTLRSAGSKSDPYAVFEKMLGRGNPPDDWDALIAATRSDWNKPKA